MSDAVSQSHVHYDFAVIGAGPAGQKAAVQAAKLGKRVLLVDREGAVGGECVHRGTIPSKALRHSAQQLAAVRGPEGAWMQASLADGTTVPGLMHRLDAVLRAHEQYMGRQIERNGVAHVQGRARFVSPRELEIERPRAGKLCVGADFVLVASGSRPRVPPGIPVDHEHVLDSDSILSLLYLPKSLLVLGAGIIACEFASIFQALGVRVTIVDKAPVPMGFLDADLSAAYVRAFEQAGGTFLAGRGVAAVDVDPLGWVVAQLDDGTSVRTEKMLCAQGRIANLAGLNLEAVGLAPNKRGYLEVDAHCRTSVPSIYAAGDVIGPPALATAAMEQGRRAAQHAFGAGAALAPESLPSGIYTIPELATVGLSEAQALERHGGALVGRAKYAELARGQINGCPDGFIKLVTGPDGRRIVGCHIAGESASELVHVAQIAMVAQLEVDAFVEQIFNFPTFAEGFRVAALDVIARRAGANSAQLAA
ncbi:MAG: Si-specific NAD(P)(+) transhydrogenase [Planctomycetota bacterium]|nr:MAG: Si-specific NAD(P)(+) transhydrogenase [Planctomycetota bacterium]